MPYYRKGTLSNHIKRIKTQTDIVCLLYQITMAFLAFSKYEGCWHLDLKPDNILFKDEGEYMICDFGCAKLVDNLGGGSMLALSQNRGVGTTRYAAPEVILEMSGSKFTDMWSLGIILYEIIYEGKHPLMNIEK